MLCNMLIRLQSGISRCGRSNITLWENCSIVNNVINRCTVFFVYYCQLEPLNIIAANTATSNGSKWSTGWNSRVCWAPLFETYSKGRTSHVTRHTSLELTPAPRCCADTPRRRPRCCRWRFAGQCVGCSAGREVNAHKERAGGEK